MILVWISEGSPRYSSMEPGQKIAYISDIGAQGLQPLFIAGSAVTVVVFDAVFISERWLRHRGRLAHNTSRAQKILSICAIIFAVIGAAGLILLTIFDTVDYPNAHDAFLAVFMYVAEYFLCTMTLHTNSHLQRRLHYLSNLHLRRVPASWHPLP